MDTSGLTNEACITGAALPSTNRVAKSRWVYQIWMGIEAILMGIPALSADVYRGHTENPKFQKKRPDFMAWHPDRRGIFTFWSAYHIGLEAQQIRHNIVATSDRPDELRQSGALFGSTKQHQSFVRLPGS
jgi:hypothetical protein